MMTVFFYLYIFFLGKFIAGSFTEVYTQGTVRDNSVGPRGKIFPWNDFQIWYLLIYEESAFAKYGITFCF